MALRGWLLQDTSGSFRAFNLLDGFFWSRSSKSWRCLQGFTSFFHFFFFSWHFCLQLWFLVTFLLGFLALRFFDFQLLKNHSMKVHIRSEWRSNLPILKDWLLVFAASPYWRLDSTWLLTRRLKLSFWCIHLSQLFFTTWPFLGLIRGFDLFFAWLILLFGWFTRRLSCQFFTTCFTL